MMIGAIEGTHPDLRRVLSNVLEAVLPTPDEASIIEGAGRRLLSRVRKVSMEVGGPDIRPVMAGSVAKGTMMRDPDLDVFLLFPPGTEADVLERQGLEIGTRSLEDPGRKYTQHPYITGRFEEFNADIVPCLDIEKGGRVQTAVDRTPHHTDYIKARLKGNMRADVVLFKSFLKGTGAYGAEETVKGLSGYLVELMVLYFGDILRVLEYFSSLAVEGEAPPGCEEVRQEGVVRENMEPILFDREELLDQAPLGKGHYLDAFRNDRFIVVDPVDPGRNVASPISSQTLDLLINSSRSFLDSPSRTYFYPFTMRPHRPKQGLRAGEKGGSFVSMPLPDGDPGMVISQLRKALSRGRRDLLRQGFKDVTIRYLITNPEGHPLDPNYLKGRYIWEGGAKVPRIYLSISTIPKVLDRKYEHFGPPVGSSRAKAFTGKHRGANVFERGGRLMAVKERELREGLPLFQRFWEGGHHPSAFREVAPTFHRDGNGVEGFIRTVLLKGKPR